jgi:CheY-like chemotaxis protein
VVVSDALLLSGPVLIVEDDENDALLVKRAFERAGLANEVQVLTSGCLAIAYLNGDPPYEDLGKYPAPALVLLDLKLPGMDGFEVLKWIRRQPPLESLPVVVLTGADELNMVSQAHELGATAFLVKPLDFWNAAELMRSLQRAAVLAPARHKHSYRLGTISESTDLSIVRVR